jgi:O-succinylbenzoate synthase
MRSTSQNLLLGSKINSTSKLPKSSLGVFTANQDFLLSDLIVNSRPDLPLRVPLDKSMMPASVKAEILKKHNLNRYETVACNLQANAEQER